jgi:acetylornithine deacetylase/succinyl-diaminopimelate desuccinylase-like protein
LFDPDRAHDHTRALSFPRRVGTPGERRALRYLLREFRAAGLRPWREDFSVSHFPAEVGSRIVFAGCGLLVLLGAWLATTWPFAAALCWAAAAVLTNAPWRVQHFVSAAWPPRTTSANLLATLPDRPAATPARVVFLAHYDTKSQLLPTGVRVGLVTAATLLCGLLAVLAVAAMAFPEILPAARAWRLAWVVLVLLVGLIANVTGNRSPGALDNGSGLGTLLELARCWRPDAPAPVEAVWVATGSEEVGLDGARHLLETHASWWQDRPTLLINLESVGAGATVYLAGQPAALRLAREVAGELGLPHAPLRVLGAGMDHEPFAARGLPAVSILGDVVRTSFALHSSRDGMGLIDRAALDRAGRLAAHLAWQWARLHQPAPETVPTLVSANAG